MSDLAALIERVRGATGPDREIDAMLWCLSEGRIWCDDRFTIYGQDASRPNSMVRIGTVDPGEQQRNFSPAFEMPAYTASIDAALALVERKAPGRWQLILDDATNSLWNSVHREDGLKMLPLFILLALLTALSTQESPK